MWRHPAGVCSTAFWACWFTTAATIVSPSGHQFDAGARDRVASHLGRVHVASCSDAELEQYAFIAATGPAPGAVAPRPPQCVPSLDQGLWPLRQLEALPRKQASLSGASVVLSGGKSHLSSGLSNLNVTENSRGVTSRSNGTYFAHLYVVQSSSDWCAPPCNQASWELAAPKPDDGSNYVLFEAAIWRQERRVALYRFDSAWMSLARKSYHSLCGGVSWGCTGYLVHRESRRLLQVGPWPVSADNDKAELSTFLLEAFKQVFAKVQEAAPDAKHVGVTYSGHGGRADGSLFEGALQADDAFALLESRSAKLAVLNFGTNCEEGRWNMLKTLHPYAEWILASDLKVGGINVKKEDNEEDSDTISSWQRLADVAVLKQDAEEEMSLADMMQHIADARAESWNTYYKAAILREKKMQSVAAYHTPDFASFEQALRSTWEAASPDQRFLCQLRIQDHRCDVLEGVKFFEENTTSAQDLEQKFLALRPIYASTQTLFTWPVVTNGLGFNYLGWKSEPCDLQTALGVEASPPSGGWNGVKWDESDELTERYKNTGKISMLRRKRAKR